MLYPGEFDFYPTSWVIPEQYHQFIGEVAGTKLKSGRATPSGLCFKLHLAILDICLFPIRSDL